MKNQDKIETVRRLYIKLRDEGKNLQFSEDAIRKELESKGLKLEDDVVQEILQRLAEAGNIELRREKAVYLRLVQSRLEVDMSSILNLLRRVKDDAGDKFRKSSIVYYLQTLHLNLDDERIQTILEQWQAEGKIELIREDDLYLRLLK